MKRLALVLGALMFVVLVHPVQAQIGTRFLIGGGVQIPTGDFAQYAKTGWHALGGVEFSPPLSPVGFRVDGFYGRSSTKARPAKPPISMAAWVASSTTSASGQPAPMCSEARASPCTATRPARLCSPTSRKASSPGEAGSA